MCKKVTMILTNYFNPDPRVYKEARYLVDRGFSVTVLCWYREDLEGLALRENIDGINVIRFRIKSELGSGTKQIPEYLKFIYECKHYFKMNDTDYIHCNDLDGAIAGWLSRKGGTPFVFDMHEFYEDVGEGHEIKRRVLRSLTKFFIRHSLASIRTNDLYIGENYKSVQDKMILLKNLPDPDLIKAIPKTKSDKFRIGYHGGVRQQYEEFKTLFEATKDLEDTQVDIWGGGSDLKRLQEIAPNYPNVIIHGYFDGARQLTKLYADTDVEFAGYRPYSNTREHQEVVKFFECIITGTPMILTEAYTKMRKDIESNGYGLTCDTRNVEEVKRCILKLKNDRAFWLSCAQNELRNANQYNWKSAVTVLDKVYK